MNLVLRIPDILATRLGEVSPDLERQALEALVLENFRAGRMTNEDLRETLGFEILSDVDSFLKAHGVYQTYSVADLEGERADRDRLGPIEPEPINLAEAIRQRFAPVGGVDDLIIPPRELVGEPLQFER